MNPDFTAAVCQGFYGSLEELLIGDLPAGARVVLLDLQERTGIAIDALTEQSMEVSQQQKERTNV
jgi:hypothetical protein